MARVQVSKTNGRSSPRRRLWPWGAAALAIIAGLSFLDRDDETPARVTPPEATEPVPPRPNGIFDAEPAYHPADELHNAIILDKARKDFEAAQERSAENSVSGYPAIRLHHIGAIAYTGYSRADAEPDFYIGTDTEMRTAVMKAENNCRRDGHGTCRTYQMAIEPGLLACFAFNRSVAGAIGHTAGGSPQEAFDAMAETCAIREEQCRFETVPVLCNDGSKQNFTLAR